MSDVGSTATGAWTAAARAWVRDLRAALAFPLTSDGRLLAAGAVTLASYVLVLLSSFPQFSMQLLSRDPADLPWAVAVLTEEAKLNGGWLGICLLAAYALLTGVAVTNAAALVRRVRYSGVSTVAGVVPGLLAAGCASCGAGLLGLLGFAGAMAALPFDGTLLRLGGVLFLVFFLGRAGDPRTCRI
ncbi:hypothetical protein [Natronomonas salina]|uniref:hypothetical protein n=1 Tax=Natronomonas salina TaxID=1710540 RepID=UPI001FEBB54A|nr:hypothetical protein [Natronomonas salina]